MIIKVDIIILAMLVHSFYLVFSKIDELFPTSISFFIIEGLKQARF